MRIEYDEIKRGETLRIRGLDMADAALVFDGLHMTIEDDRRDYGEPRFITVGFIKQRMIYVAWTPRGSIRRIISMRKANAREQARYGPQLAAR